MVEPRYDVIEYERDGMIKVKVGRRYGFLDSSGAEVIPPRFGHAGAFAEGLAAAREGIGLLGYIDRTGAWVIALAFQRAGPFRYGLAIAQRKFNEPRIYIDRTGKTVHTFPRRSRW